MNTGPGLYFKFSFSDEWIFARKRAGEITCKCLRAGKSYEKSDTLSHRVWRSLQKWHAWLLSPLELPYCSQSKINSFNLFQGPYLQNRDFWESILWSQETKSIISDPKASKCSGVARGGVQWEVLGTHSDVQC